MAYESGPSLPPKKLTGGIADCKKPDDPVNGFPQKCQR